MKFFDETFREIFLSQIVLLIGGLIAGTILAVYTDNLLLIPVCLSSSQDFWKCAEPKRLSRSKNQLRNLFRFHKSLRKK
jgi:hypothetical protein